MCKHQLARSVYLPFLDITPHYHNFTSRDREGEAALHLAEPVCQFLHSGKDGETILNVVHVAYEVAGMTLNLYQLIETAAGGRNAVANFIFIFSQFLSVDNPDFIWIQQTQKK